MSDLVHDMRAVCVLAARHPREADAMASVLQVISAIERIANAAVDIARIVTHRLGIPRELVADLSERRGGVAPGAGAGGLATSPAGRCPTSSCRCRPACGSWPSAGAGTGSPTSTATTVLRARRRAVPARARRPASTGCGSWPAAPPWEPPMPPEDGAAHRPRPGRRRARRDEEHLRGRRRPGLLGARAARPGPGRRGPPPRGPPRRDEGPARAVGAAGRRRTTSTRRRCGACCTCPRRPRTSATRPSRWCGSSSSSEELHPILGLALGETDEVVVRVPVAAGHPRPTGATLGRAAARHRARLPRARHPPGRPLRLPAPAATSRLQAGDELIASRPRRGPPDAGRAASAGASRGRGDRRAGARPD